MSDTLPGLDQLRELPLPAPISYWPQTWGWLVVAGLLLAACILAAAAYWRRHRRNLYRRQALVELDALIDSVVGNPLAARELPGLLKRAALAAQNQDRSAQVGVMGGDAWLAYLSRSAKSASFPDGSTRLLTTLAYGPDEAVCSLDPTALQRLIAASRRWMEHHHVAA
ncbi:hypothetical protein PT7_1859 [Pusillimonas sp. T7-7]|uniref:DUF4381 domain-containing protein n=1 Tax=Pusillimonas sp. (strain T7-7) TaxID=1007105 RepID=UPI000208461B|nr:DUF4381 domain-containing protein [Pusillimonas sp. T7-7]AEC20399.1 hypothetical protein PT7_1859 [Pusillimonas sp. T7-7]